MVNQAVGGFLLIISAPPLLVKAPDYIGNLGETGRGESITFEIIIAKRPARVSPSIAAPVRDQV